MKIGIDIEGVLADIHTLFIKKYNLGYQTKFRIEDITNWSLENTKIGIKDKEFAEFVRELWHNHWNEIPMIEEDAAEKLRTFSKFCEICIATNCVALDGRNAKLGETNLLKWMEKYGLFYNRFIPLGMGKNKADLEYDYLIDDNPFLVEEMKKRKKFMFLYNRPWNKDINESKYIKRIFSLSEVMGFLKK